MIVKILHIACRDTILGGLIAEQIRGHQSLSLGLREQADLIITDSPGEAGDAEGGKRLFLLPPLPLRLGEAMDAVRYTLSGRRRQAEEGGQGPVRIGESLILTADNFLVREGGREGAEKTIRLTDKERSLLRALLSAPDERLSRKTLLQTVWGYAEGAETHTLETHLYRLRQKLQELGPGPLLTAEDGWYSLKI